MKFYTEFIRTLRWRPAQALRALYWHITGRRVRARNWLRRGADKAPYAYDLWIETVERSSNDAAVVLAQPDQWLIHPLISIILPWHSDEDSNQLISTIRSVELQTYPHWELLVPIEIGRALPASVDRASIRRVHLACGDAAEALNKCTSAARGDFLLVTPLGATLPPTALLHYVSQLQRAPDATILFGDHDQIDEKGRRLKPWFKPQWNAEMILGQDYISAACVIRTADAQQINPIEPDLGSAAAYTLVLRTSSLFGAKISHVPHVLAHLPISTAETDNQSARTLAVSRLLASVDARATPGPYGLVRVKWPLPNICPLVSVIIPTRDRADLLRTCIQSLRRHTTWPNYEILIVDNHSVDPETISYFDELRCMAGFRILEYAKPYNYSAINNYAASVAQGAYLCFLNNDTEILNARWLEAMVRHAVRPEVGAVGAKLLYQDGSVQHAGVIIGMGNAAGHAHRFQKPGDRGYFDQVDLTRFVSAVTAACLVVDKKKFETVGGFDSDKLHIAYNDVDLCLKLQQAGWANVYEPDAALMHYESKSRGNDLSPQHLERYLSELSILQTRWGTKTAVDPSHHPRLDRSQETYVIDF
jgi:GT2 family glycosyltransferase